MKIAIIGHGNMGLSDMTKSIISRHEEMISEDIEIIEDKSLIELCRSVITDGIIVVDSLSIPTAEELFNTPESMEELFNIPEPIDFRSTGFDYKQHTKYNRRNENVTVNRNQKFIKSRNRNSIRRTGRKR